MDRRSVQSKSTAATLVSLANSCVLSIGTRKLDLSLEMPIGGDSLTSEGIESFSVQVSDTTGIVTDHLGLTDFVRIGCRVWYLFPCDTQEESENWLASLGCYNVNEGLFKAFGGTSEAVGVSVVVIAEDRKYRIAFNGVQRSATVDVGKEVLNLRVKDLPSGQREMLLEQEKAKARMRQTPDFPAMIGIFSSASIASV